MTEKNDFIYFVIAGGATTLIAYLIYSLLIYIDIIYIASSIAANTAGFIFNLIVVRLYVFKIESNISAEEIKILLLLWLIGAITHIFIIRMLYDFGAGYYIGGAIASILILFWNYFSRRWYYNRKEPYK